MSKKAEALLGSLCLIVLIGLALLATWQITKVNEEAPRAQIEEYHLGETINLDGSFLESTSEENKNYSICISRAERMSYNQYIEKYGNGKNKAVESGDDKSIISLEMTITNNGKGLGCLSVYDMRLLPESKNTYYIAQESIWNKSEKKLPTWPNPISIEPGSSYTVHVPFTVNTDEESITRGYIQGTEFTLYLTDWPISKRVVFSLEN